MPKFEIGAITTYCDAAVIEAENEGEALRIAREMNSQGNWPQTLGGSELEYTVLHALNDSEAQKTEAWNA